jgi:hypothetical protein
VNRVEVPGASMFPSAVFGKVENTVGNRDTAIYADKALKLARHSIKNHDR